MTLKKSSFVCKVAYPFTEDAKLPKITSVCKLFWRFLLMLITVYPIMIAIVVIVVIVSSIIFWIGYVPFKFLKGERVSGIKGFGDYCDKVVGNWDDRNRWRPVDDKSDNDEAYFEWKNIDRWPRTKQGERINFIDTILGALVVAFLVAILSFLYYVTLYNLELKGYDGHRSIAAALGTLCALGVIVALITLGYKKLSSGKLIRSWWKAKKEKVCPIVEFVD